MSFVSILKEIGIGEERRRQEGKGDQKWKEKLLVANQCRCGFCREKVERKGQGRKVEAPVHSLAG